ncbi:uncharacterized protein TNCV_1598591 [Trichonephila clavipes]|nr:uncharacterized protein TNCV_1598591 [Trichonephila clavipes]
MNLMLLNDGQRPWVMSEFDPNSPNFLIPPTEANTHQLFYTMVSSVVPWHETTLYNYGHEFVIMVTWLVRLHCLTTRGLLATDHVILNHGQVTWTTPELEPPLLTTTPHHREDVSALDRFNVHRCPTRRVFSGTGLKPVTKQATVRYLYHSATAATPCPVRARIWDNLKSVKNF